MVRQVDIQRERAIRDAVLRAPRQEQAKFLNMSQRQISGLSRRALEELIRKKALTSSKPLPQARPKAGFGEGIQTKSVFTGFQKAPLTGAQRRAKLSRRASIQERLKRGAFDEEVARQRAKVEAEEQLPSFVDQDKPVFTIGTALRILGKTVEDPGRVKLFKDSSGAVIGVSDPKSRQSFRIKPASEKVVRRKLKENLLERRLVESSRASKILEDRLPIRKNLLTFAQSKEYVVSLKGTISALQKTPWKTNKGVTRLKEEISRAEVFISSHKGSGRGTFKAQSAAALLFFPGVVRGAVDAVGVILNPIDFAKTVTGVAKSFVKDPAKTTSQIVNQFGRDFLRNPYGFVGEAVGESFVGGSFKRLVKSTPIVRYIDQQRFINSLPKAKRPAVRNILKALSAQKGLEPLNKIPSKIDFLDVRELTSVEAKALFKTLKETNSIVFGSKSARVLSEGKTKIPGDVDLATSNVEKFNKKFLSNLPPGSRKKYTVKKEKILRGNVKILDVKPLSRLQPDKFFGKGSLPIFEVKKIKGVSKPVIIEAPIVFKTSRPVNIGGIKLTTFSEQTLRKGLGTLQVILEGALQRSKDPSSFIESLDIQLDALIKTKPLSPVGKIRRASKVKRLSGSIAFLKSNDFKRLLNTVDRSILKRYPLVDKLKGVKFKKLKIKKVVKAKTKKLKVKKAKLKKSTKSRTVKKRSTKKKVKPVPKSRKNIPKKKKTKKVSSDLRRRSTSRLPSRLPKKSASKLPSKLPKKRVSRLPSRLPKKSVSKIPSKVPKKSLSKLPRKSVSKVPSRLPKRKISKLPSKIPPRSISKLPSKIPSRLPSKLPKRRPKKFKKLPEKLRDEEEDPFKPRGGKVPVVDARVRIKGKTRLLRLGLPVNKAFNKISGAIDRTTSRSFDLIVVGYRKAKDVKTRNANKFRPKRSSRRSKVLRYVEKSKFAIDTLGEKKGLKLSKLLKTTRRKGKPLKKTVTKKRVASKTTVKRRTVKRRVGKRK